MPKRIIKQVTVLGSGVMGSRIACHFANTGIQVLLLDIVPADAGTDKKSRNKIVDTALEAAIKSNPAPLYSRGSARLIRTGNFTDNMAEIASSDWIIEVVVERLDIKKQVFEEVEKYRKPGTIVTSNTSGIPIAMMSEGRTDDFRKHFCGTHFFNPPRYLRLLEIIPGPDTLPDVISFLGDYGEQHLGKATVICKDTPAFIANRIGVYGIMELFHLMNTMNLTIDEVDKLTGPVLGRPKSATFRTCDVVGLDTLVHVAKGVAANCPTDEAGKVFEIPDYILKMVENKWLGAKTDQGFYKKVKKDGGKSEIHVLNLKTLEYGPSAKVKFPTLEAAKAVDSLPERLKTLINGKDKAAEFYRITFSRLFAYVSHRVPEIADELYKVDIAMNAGFGWQSGPFEMWDAIGVRNGVEMMKAAGTQPAAWVGEMLEKGVESFYRIEDGIRSYYHAPEGRYLSIPGYESFILLGNLNTSHTVWQNSGSTITDIGDGILNLEFHSKMNTMGGEVIAGINKAVDIAEKDFRGLVISNEGANFSAGANVGMIFMMAVEQEWDELNFAISAFQKTMMRARYSNIPVVVAPHNMALGGSTELSMHSDKVVSHAELYMGLVEFGVGLIPGGGGTKEFALRLADELSEGDLELNKFRERFLTIGQAKVSTSAAEAFDLGYLRKGIDEIVVSRPRLLASAKKACIALADSGYSAPVPRKNIRVLGKQALGLAYLGANAMKSGNYISEHDEKISRKLAWVLCGGDLSSPSLVSEQYLLDLEREAFLSLCGERKTLERIQSIISGGKVLRN